MTVQVQKILHLFELLPENDKRELAGEILRRSLSLDSPALSDEELVCAADEPFRKIDEREAFNDIN
jgi:hypothetical protein